MNRFLTLIHTVAKLHGRLRPWSFCKMRLDRVWRCLKWVACELLFRPWRHDRLRHDFMSFSIFIPSGMRCNSAKGSTKWREPGQVRQVRQLEVAAAKPSFSECWQFVYEFLGSGEILLIANPCSSASGQKTYQTYCVTRIWEWAQWLTRLEKQVQLYERRRRPFWWFVLDIHRLAKQIKAARLAEALEGNPYNLLQAVKEFFPEMPEVTVQGPTSSR